VLKQASEADREKPAVRGRSRREKRAKRKARDTARRDVAMCDATWPDAAVPCRSERATAARGHDPSENARKSYMKRERALRRHRKRLRNASPAMSSLALHPLRRKQP
jgi:hypothetical protein